MTSHYALPTININFEFVPFGVPVTDICVSIDIEDHDIKTLIKDSISSIATIYAVNYERLFDNKKTVTEGQFMKTYIASMRCEIMQIYDKECIRRLITIATHPTKQDDYENHPIFLTEQQGKELNENADLYKDQHLVSILYNSKSGDVNMSTNINKSLLVKSDDELHACVPLVGGTSHKKKIDTFKNNVKKYVEKEKELFDTIICKLANRAISVDDARSAINILNVLAINAIKNLNIDAWYGALLLLQNRQIFMRS